MMKNLDLIYKLFITVILLVCLNQNAWSQDKKVYQITSMSGLLETISILQKDIESGKSISKGDVIVTAQGPVVKHFSVIPGAGSPKAQISKLESYGIDFEVCSLSIVANQIKPNQLLPGVKHIDQGAPARIEELVSKGYQLIEK